jgi:hypothetical protein
MLNKYFLVSGCRKNRHISYILLFVFIFIFANQVLRSTSSLLAASAVILQLVQLSVVCIHLIPLPCDQENQTNTAKTEEKGLDGEDSF